MLFFVLALGNNYILFPACLNLEMVVLVLTSDDSSNLM
jgi:hypothetical protein